MTKNGSEPQYISSENTSQSIIAALGKPVEILIDRNGKKIDFTNPNFYGEISDFNFSGYDLRNVNWSEIKSIRSADLSGALIDGSKWAHLGALCDVNLTGAKIVGGTISAKMKDCNLSHSTFTKVVFRSKGIEDYYVKNEYIHWENIFAYNTTFNDVTFASEQKSTRKPEFKITKSNFLKASFNNTTFQKCFFFKSNLENTTFIDSRFEETRLTYTKMKKATFRNSAIAFIIEDSDCRNISFDNCDISNSKFMFYGTENKTKHPGRWVQARRKRDYVYGRYSNYQEKYDFRVKVSSSKLSIVNSDISSTIFFGDISKTKIRNTFFTGITFEDCNMSNTDHENTRFIDCNFIRTKGTRISFKNTLFKNVNFGENITKSDFSQSNFADTTFVETTLGNSNVKFCGWKGANTEGLDVFPDAQSVPVAEKENVSRVSNKNMFYEHYTLRQVKRKLRLSDEELSAFLKLNKVDVRDNYTKLRTFPDTKKTFIHVPVWEYQNLGNKQNQSS